MTTKTCFVRVVLRAQIFRSPRAVVFSDPALKCHGCAAGAVKATHGDKVRQREAERWWLYCEIISFEKTCSSYNLTGGLAATTLFAHQIHSAC
eukprot:2076190-Pyramimonas_sp.AAC.1